MKLPDWSNTHQRWDKYKAFHIGINKNGYKVAEWYYDRQPPFIMFDTGEVILLNCPRDPCSRGEFSLLDVALYDTRHQDAPTMYLPDGTPVKKAWLNHSGQQYVLFDHHTKRAVGTSGRLLTGAMPSRFYSNGWPIAQVYFAGPEEIPVGHPIRISRPHRDTLTAEEHEHCDTLLTTARAAMALAEHPITLKRWHASTGAYPQDLLRVKRWDELDAKVLEQLYFNGLTRDVREYPYLTF